MLNIDIHSSVTYANFTAKLEVNQHTSSEIIHYLLFISMVAFYPTRLMQESAGLN